MYAHDVCHEYVVRGHDENDSYQHDDDSNQNGDEPQRPVVAVTMNDAATTQMRGAMEIAAQSVVAYLPIVPQPEAGRGASARVLGLSVARFMRQTNLLLAR